MQEDALSKLMTGLTTLEEILRVIPVEAVRDIQCTKCYQQLMPSFKFCPSCGTRRALETAEHTRQSRELVPEEITQS